LIGQLTDVVSIHRVAQQPSPRRTALFHRKKSTDFRSCIFLLSMQQRQNDMTFSVVATAAVAVDLQ